MCKLEDEAGQICLARENTFKVGGLGLEGI